MAVEPAVLDDRCGRGVAVELVDPLRLFFPEDLDIVENPARLPVEADGVQPDRLEHRQRLAAGIGLEAFFRVFFGGEFFMRGRQPHMLSRDDRG